MTAFFALLVVFGSAPVVGDEFQTSLLTASEREVYEQADPEVVRKALLKVLKEFVDDCERFKLRSCMERGKKLIVDIARPAADPMYSVGLAESFAEEFEGILALSACKFDLQGTFQNVKKADGDFVKFFEKYGDLLPANALRNVQDSIGTSESGLKELVDFCAKELYVHAEL